MKYNPFQIEGDKVKINFALFKNDRREKETHPQAKSWDKETGLSVSAWTRQTQNGDKYQSCVMEFPIDQIIALVKDDLVKETPPVNNAAPIDDGLPF